ncbi:hypothetical protein PTSG_11719 [Salpingoeca rosetta]|uniref:Integrase catalytic domain-containing protein n=1 Tax=Salpingoeca rosetta (strain ATCC 50818 / BSB-021) TaxID=946362 RepID=F2U081_SALR5|nr:uncharacterized protein PTSG_11719 [Salpingoeca rosetta]EGD80809.1 hypothetical protein PTSG_11719 [Salpingoeca rosetta]|eukprot:XP_004997370.1 hypothetical protein PTSG_11719 [Salpingoeca rosetta]
MRGSRTQPQAGGFMASAPPRRGGRRGFSNNSNNHGRQGRNNGNSNGNSNGKGRRFRGNCHYCGKYGHRAAECRKKQRDNGATGFTAQAQHQHGQNAATFVAATATTPTQLHDPLTWLADTGASHHLTFVKDAFVELTPHLQQHHPRHITAFGGTRVPVRGVGSVLLHARTTSGATMQIVLQECLYVPEGQANLIALGRLTRDSSGRPTGHSQRDGADGHYVRFSHGAEVKLKERSSLRCWPIVAVGPSTAHGLTADACKQPQQPAAAPAAQSKLYMELPPAPPRHRRRALKGYAGKVSGCSSRSTASSKAGRAWAKKLHTFLKTNGWAQRTSDACLFTKLHDDGQRTWIITYVDDLIISGSSERHIRACKQQIKESFEEEDLGPLTWYLGLHLTSPADGVLHIAQTQAINDIVNDYNLAAAASVSTPMRVGIDASSISEQPDRRLPFRNLVGSLLYLANRTRPDHQLHQLDFKSAYLQADLKEELYMKLPPHFTDIGDGAQRYAGKVCRLLKPLYGLKQAGRAWAKKLHTFLKTNGWAQSNVDACLFTKLHDDGQRTWIITYVDDLIISGSSERHIRACKQQIKESFEAEDLGPLTWYLGLHLTSPADGVLHIAQTQAINDIVNDYNLAAAASVSTPMRVGIDASSISEQPDRRLPFRNLVGSLLYLANRTRPDVSFAMSDPSDHVVSTPGFKMDLPKFSGSPGTFHAWSIRMKMALKLRGDDVWAAVEAGASSSGGPSSATRSSARRPTAGDHANLTAANLIASTLSGYPLLLFTNGEADVNAGQGWARLKDHYASQDRLRIAELKEAQLHLHDPLTWLADTGASHHLTFVKDAFVELTPHLQQHHPRHITAFGGTRVPVRGVGSVLLHARTTSGATMQIVLQECLYVPEGQANLIALGRLTRDSSGRPTGHSQRDGADGHYVRFSHGAEVKLKERSSLRCWPIVAVGPSTAHGLTADACKQPQQPAAAPAAQSKVQTPSMHEVLGHRNDNDVQQYCKLMGIDDRNAISSKQCATCAVTKSTRHSVSKHAERTQVPGERIHADIVDWTADSPTGKRYSLVIVDEGSKLLHAVHLNAKKDAVAAFQSFLRETKLPISPTTTALQTDSDAIFLGADFQAIVKKHLKQHQQSPPYTQAQNGIVERQVRTLSDMLLMDLDEPEAGATKMLTDNQAAIAIGNDHVTKPRTKHIRVRHHFVRELIADGTIVLQHCPGTRMVADALTKALDKQTFEQHLPRLVGTATAETEQRKAVEGES